MKTTIYPVKAKNIYAGKLLKLKTIKEQLVIGTDGSENTIVLKEFNACRTMLFKRDENNMAIDLLYDSPNYPITTDLNFACVGEKEFIVEKVLNIGQILEYFGYPQELNSDQIASLIKFFDMKFLRDNCHVFGYRVRTMDEVTNFFVDELSTGKITLKKIKRMYERYKDTSGGPYCYDFDIESDLPREYFDKLMLLSGNPIGKDIYGDSFKMDIFRPELLQEGRVKKLVRKK